MVKWNDDEYIIEFFYVILWFLNCKINYDSFFISTELNEQKLTKSFSPEIHKKFLTGYTGSVLFPESELWQNEWDWRKLSEWRTTYSKSLS